MSSPSPHSRAAIISAPVPISDRPLTAQPPFPGHHCTFATAGRKTTANEEAIRRQPEERDMSQSDTEKQEKESLLPRVFLTTET